jgi:hypothetical protein
MPGHVEELTAGKNPIRGGSSETEVNELHAIPVGLPSTVPVTTTTPEGQCPSTSRKASGSMVVVGVLFMSVLSRARPVVLVVQGSRPAGAHGGVAGNCFLPNGWQL